MQSYSDEVGVPDYIQLMKDYLGGRIDAQEYTRNYFDLNAKRVWIPNEEASRITQQAYGDADDYEPDAALREKNAQWIGEQELRNRVAKSLRELEALGHQVDQD